MYLFNEIYTLAKTGNIKRITELLQNGICLDVMDSSIMFTPAMKLASEGNKNAANILVNLGANINKVARGFAMNGDMDEVEMYKAQGASADEIGAGFAMGNFHIQALSCITYDDADPSIVIQGYAYTSNQVYIKKYKELYKDKIEPIQIGMIQATAGHTDSANDYLDVENEKSYLINVGHVIANNKIEIKKYKDQNHDLTLIGYGHALAGRSHKANKYRTAENATQIAKAYASSGHNFEAEEYRRKYNADPTEIAKMYAGMQYLREVRTYCTQFGVKLDELIPLLIPSFTNSKIALRTLAFIDDEPFRQQLINLLHHSKLLDFNILGLTARAKKINQHMTQEHLTYTQALAATEPSIKGLFAYHSQMMPDFHKDALMLIASYVTPISFKEAKSLHTKVIKPAESSKKPAAENPQSKTPRGRAGLFAEKKGLSVHKPTATSKTSRFPDINAHKKPGWR